MSFYDNSLGTSGLYQLGTLQLLNPNKSKTGYNNLLQQLHSINKKLDALNERVKSLNKEVETLNKNYTTLKNQNNEIKKRNDLMWYAPGMPGYLITSETTLVGKEL